MVRPTGLHTPVALAPAATTASRLSTAGPVTPATETISSPKSAAHRTAATTEKRRWMAGLASSATSSTSFSTRPAERQDAET